MTHNGWGRVVVVSSPLADEPAPGLSAYATAKAAQQALILQPGRRTARHGRDGQPAAKCAPSKRMAKRMQERIRKRTPKRMGKRMERETARAKAHTPEEIVAAMLYLCSDQAAQINGARIPLYL